ncbi:MAG TPA: MotA/TolQ/ExbB proton channel family protein [Candidatus Binatia bacterium]|jgi:biopolymer transport protein TolQ|nr:MotA/TolQ/ExbB proton channel family protein [Candidatus Binatia bacterium]
MNMIGPMLAAEAPGNAITFAYHHLTKEGFATVIALIFVSIFSWTVIISKARQLIRARKMGKKFFEAYRATRDPMDIFREKKEFDGAPAYELYITGAEEVAYHLKNNPVEVVRVKRVTAGNDPHAALGGETDVLSRSISTKISTPSFESVQVALERAASTEALSLEKGMIILSTAVAGGPFIGLFGTVWGVMETFSGIGRAGAASLTAMAPGVAAALLATVAGLSVAIPAMFAYNYMVTTIRGITQELDGFSSEYATELEHKYVDNRPLAEEIRDALQSSGMLQPRAQVAQPPAIPVPVRKLNAPPQPAFTT